MNTYAIAPIKQTDQQDLSAGALSFTYTFNKDGCFEWVGIAFDGNVTETVTVTYDSATGAAYDLVFDSTDLSAEASYIYKPQTPFKVKIGDAIKVTCTNATATETASLTAMFTEIETFLS